LFGDNQMPRGMGCTRRYLRDWTLYNERLVSRGEVLLDLSWVGRWKGELERINRGKRGRPYVYPPSLVRMVEAVKAVLGAPLRMLEGILRVLGEVVLVRVPDYTTLWHRLKDVRLPVKAPVLNCGEDGFVIAVDSTGLKVSNRGEWLREKWRVHRGWVKVHAAVEVTTGAVVGVAISDERADDARFLRMLVLQAEARLPGRVKRVLGDGAYDKRESFDFLRAEGIEAGIKLRSGASRKSLGHGYARPLAVLERNRLGEEGWKERYHYNERWRCEVTFSAIKRMFGENITARRRDLMFREAKLRFQMYNKRLACK